jgi:hypothetical protein
MAVETRLGEFQELLVDGGLPELGPGPRPNVLPHAALETKLDRLLARTDLPSVSHDLIRALVLLWHDRLDAAHEIAQGIEDANGSFVHGIVHRREPDFSNAKYWFRRTGDHECFPELARRVSERLDATAARDLASKLVVNGKWDSLAFIDQCAAANGRGKGDAETGLLRETQGIESEVLLAYLLGR